MFTYNENQSTKRVDDHSELAAGAQYAVVARSIDVSDSIEATLAVTPGAHASTRISVSQLSQLEGLINKTYMHVSSVALTPSLTA
mgnify:CR=1 FL=1